MFLLNKKYFMLGYVTEICYVPVGKIKYNHINSKQKHQDPPSYKNNWKHVLEKSTHSNEFWNVTQNLIFMANFIQS